MQLEIEVEDKLLIIYVDGIDTVFTVLKPALTEQIIEEYKGCRDESQVMVFTSGLLAMGAISL